MGVAPGLFFREPFPSSQDGEQLRAVRVTSFSELTCTFKSLFLDLLDKYLEVQLLGHGVILFLTF